MKRLIVSMVAVGVCSAAAMASLPFHDDFESGMGNWTIWPGAAEKLQHHGPDPWKSIDPGPWGTHEGYSARQHAYVGGGNGYKSYYDFGVQSGPISAEVWLFEDMTSSLDPIFASIQLIGADGGNVGFGTDFHQLGIIQWAGTNAFYSSRSRADGFAVSNVARKKHWTHLAIEADGPGNDVRYFIDGNLVRTTTQQAPLQYVAIGFNASNHENFWYDGVRVIPEPASALLLLLGLPLLRRRGRN